MGDGVVGVGAIGAGVGDGVAGVGDGVTGVTGVGATGEGDGDGVVGVGVTGEGAVFSGSPDSTASPPPQPIMNTVMKTITRASNSRFFTILPSRMRRQVRSRTYHPHK